MSKKSAETTEIMVTLFINAQMQIAAVKQYVDSLPKEEAEKFNSVYSDTVKKMQANSQKIRE